MLRESVWADQKPALASSPQQPWAWARMGPRGQGVSLGLAISEDLSLHLSRANPRGGLLHSRVQ